MIQVVRITLKALWVETWKQILKRTLFLALSGMMAVFGAFGCLVTGILIEFIAVAALNEPIYLRAESGV